MSYCRMGQDSDVYCIRNIEYKWNIWVSYAASDKLNIAPEGFVCDTLEEFENKLIWLKSQGCAVPRSVFKRIKKEKRSTTI